MNREISSSYGLVLAAGRGSRMVENGSSSDFPKVLRKICGKALVDYVLDALSLAGIDDITVIVGFGAEEVRSTLGTGYRYVLQQEQSGSGHAVASAAAILGNKTGTAIIMCGDSPMFTAETIGKLQDIIKREGATIAMASSTLDDPTGYGRIVRNEDGSIMQIVEEKDASELEREIKEINGGCYAFKSEWLWANIDRIERNAAGELNLTDLVRIAIADGEKVAASSCSPLEVLGVNRPEDLAKIEEAICRRSNSRA